VTELQYFNCPIIIKSTVTPDIVSELYNEDSNVVYNPEFLTEANALDDFINPPMHIFGGNIMITRRVQELYENHSQCRPCPIRHMTPAEASFVKYGINSFLATKVLWMNQFKDLCDEYNAKYNVISNVIGSDPRIGHSHMQVPGPDGRKGFGGAVWCLGRSDQLDRTGFGCRCVCQRLSTGCHHSQDFYTQASGERPHPCWNLLSAHPLIQPLISRLALFRPSFPG